MSGIVAFEGELNSIVKEVCINNALFFVIVTEHDIKIIWALPSYFV